MKALLKIRWFIVLAASGALFACRPPPEPVDEPIPMTRNVRGDASEPVGPGGPGGAPDPGLNPAGDPDPGTNPGGPDAPAGDAGAGDDGTRLSMAGLGKEDFALIEGELRCVEEVYANDQAMLTATLQAIYARYGATTEWVGRVRQHVKQEDSFKKKISGAVEERMDQVCPKGKLAAEYQEALKAYMPVAAE